MTEENINPHNLSWLNILVTSAGVFVSSVYLIGFYFYQGTLYAYKISVNAFPLSIQEVYIQSSYFIFAVFLQFENLDPKFRIIFFILASLAFLYWTVKTVQVDADKILGWCLIGGIFLYFVIPLGAYNIGKTEAKKTRDEYLKKGCFYENGSLLSNCSSLKGKDGETLYKGVLVAQSKEHVAFFNCNGTIITKIPNRGAIVNELSNEKVKSQVGFCNKVCQSCTGNNS